MIDVLFYKGMRLATEEVASLERSHSVEHRCSIVDVRNNFSSVQRVVQFRPCVAQLIKFE